MGRGGISVPKPAKGSAARARRSQRGALARRFRDAVWAASGWRCADCGCLVTRETDSDRRAGHVHHLRGRNVAPEDRYEPLAAVVLCEICHRIFHHQETRR